MSRHSTYHDFKDATGTPVYAVTLYCQSAAEREAVDAAGKRVAVAAAFDPPEVPVWPHMPPNCEGHSAGEVLAQAQHEAAISGDECTGNACLLTRGSD